MSGSAAELQRTASHHQFSIEFASNRNRLAGATALHFAFQCTTATH